MTHRSRKCVSFSFLTDALCPLVQSKTGPPITQVGIISSNNQTDNWQAQDRLYRELYAAVSHDDFLRASTAAASGAGRGGQVVMVGAGKSVETGGKEGAPELVSPLVLHPHLGLVDVLENHTCFTYQVCCVFAD